MTQSSPRQLHRSWLVHPWPGGLSPSPQHRTTHSYICRPVTESPNSTYLPHRTTCLTGRSHPMHGYSTMRHPSPAVPPLAVHPSAAPVPHLSTECHSARRHAAAAHRTANHCTGTKPQRTASPPHITVQVAHDDHKSVHRPSPNRRHSTAARLPHHTHQHLRTVLYPTAA